MKYENIRINAFKIDDGEPGKNPIILLPNMVIASKTKH